MSTLVEQAEAMMRAAWLKASGADPDGSTAFDAACWRLAKWANDEFEGELELSDVAAVVCRSRSWLKSREHWQRPPITLCDIRGTPRRRFWLVDREEAAEHGESYG